MGRWRSLMSYGVSRATMALPTRALSNLETNAQMGLGKGWGAATVHAEVQAVCSLMRTSGDAIAAVADVGANVGNWTAAMLDAAPSAQIVAFEPSAAAYADLERRYSADPRVRLVQAAVSREAGSATLWADSPGSGLASLTKRRLDHFDIGFEHAEPVDVVTLDGFLGPLGFRPDVIKLDVEGHELDALSGATETLRTARVVQFEFGGCNIDTRTFWQDYFYFFSSCGFSLNRLGPKGLQPVPRYTEADESFRTTNYFALRA